jgi:hypothetical protein
MGIALRFKRQRQILNDWRDLTRFLKTAQAGGSESDGRMVAKFLGECSIVH